MKTKVRKTYTGAVAVQASSDKGDVVSIGIGNLRVLVVPDGDCWFAQGLEIDYGAQGATITEAQKNFQYGLFETIRLHLQANGDIDSLLEFAPSTVLREAAQKGKSIKRFAQLSLHELPTEARALPFSGIDYLTAKVA